MGKRIYHIKIDERSEHILILDKTIKEINPDCDYAYYHLEGE